MSNHPAGVSHYLESDTKDTTERTLVGCSGEVVCWWVVVPCELVNMFGVG